MDAPDLQDRKAALMVRLGQQLGPQDAYRLANRMGIEQENAREGAASNVFAAGMTPNITGSGGRTAELAQLRASQANAPAPALQAPYNVMSGGMPQLPQGYGVVQGAHGNAYVVSNGDDRSQPMAGMLQSPNMAAANGFAQGQAPIPAQPGAAPMQPQPGMQPAGVMSAGMPAGMAPPQPMAFGAPPSPNSIFGQLQGTRLDPAQQAFGQAKQGQELQQGAQQLQMGQMGITQEQQRLHDMQTEKSALAAAYAPGNQDQMHAYIAAGGKNPAVLSALTRMATATAKNNNAVTDKSALQAAYAGGTDTDSNAPQSEAQTHLSNYIASGGANPSVIAGFSKQIEADKVTAQKAQQATQVQQQKEQQFLDTRGNLLDNINKAVPLIDSGAGLKSVMANIPTSDAYALKGYIDSIKAGLGVDMLKQLRASSPGGSTGIGRIMQTEFQAFSDSLANLKQGLKPADLAQNINDLKTHLVNGVGLNRLYNSNDPQKDQILKFIQDNPKDPKAQAIIAHWAEQ